MSFPTCAMAYSHVDATVSGTGIIITASQLSDIIQHYAVPILYDQSGIDALKQALDGVVDTDFEKDALEAALTEIRAPQSWEVGEAIAQAVVTHHGNCMFPWPIRRDQRNPAANQPGSDLVGFQDTGDSHRRYRFAFGEVKTSRQKQNPPSVVHGRHGLRSQIKRLRDGPPAKHHLMKYLGYRSRGTPWLAAFKSASGRLLANPSDISLYGIIVRDVPPHVDDLRSTITSLAIACPPDTRIELRATYLPTDAIPGLAKMAKAGQGKA